MYSVFRYRQNNQLVEIFTILTLYFLIASIGTTLFKKTHQTVQIQIIMLYLQNENLSTILIHYPTDFIKLRWMSEEVFSFSKQCKEIQVA